MKELPAALGAFAPYRQFIVYKSVPSVSRPGKTDKLPVNPKTGVTANAHDPSIWMDYREAIPRANELGSPFGVGFVFTERDPFWFLDIDNCLTPSGWAPHALQLSQLLVGAAIEVSQSGTGLHVFGTGRPPLHACKNDGLHIEFYHSGRFVALTGINATGDAGRNFTAMLPTLVAVYFPPDGSSAQYGDWRAEWSVRCAERVDPRWGGPADDEELIRRALNSRSAGSAFGGKASFADLWFADEQKLGACFPDTTRPYDANRADSALAQHLAFWTGKDCERIERLMLQSKLARDKFERPDYLPRTILGVVARQIDVLEAQPLVVSPMALPTVMEAAEGVSGSTAITVDGNRLLGCEEQAAFFNNCTYITDSHRVLVPGGHILKPDQFRVHYGGFSFMMDRSNERTSRDPWEAFTQSQMLRYPKVNGSCFRPDLPPGQIVPRNGQTFVNTYVPVNVRRIQGDPSPFLRHLAKVLPNQNDQMILLCYMAACVQHQGVNQGKPGKFQWAPLLQGVEGNGKTLFTRCVAEAVGPRYVHWPKASKLAKEFNAWMVGKVFFAVEDIYVPDARREVIEELKPMITGENLEIEAKGVDQTSGDICGNFMFNSNHRDAIQKTRNDRRFCVLFSAQQASEDLARDGMDGQYFPDLYNWLRNEGYAIVAEFLHTFAIPAEFNPAGDCQRAPYSSTTGEAISASIGGLEQEIQEAVAQGLPGFSGGWISSLWLDKLLERLGLQRKITLVRRKEMLESLGYRWHPALKDGRVNNLVMPDGGKPRLYIHETSIAMQITKPAEVEKSYQESNTGRHVQSLPFTRNQA